MGSNNLFSVIFGLSIFGIVLISTSNSLDVTGILEKLIQKIPCTECNETIHLLDERFSNDAQFDGIIKTLDGICDSNLLQEFLHIQKTCKKSLNAILKGIAGTLHLYKEGTFICKTVLQCGSKFDFEIAMKKGGDIGLILLSKVGNVDGKLANDLFTLLADKKEGFTTLVEQICEDASKTKNTSLTIIQKKFEEVCNFKDGDSECSFCELMTEFLASYLDKTKMLFEKLLSKVCKMIFSAHQCNGVTEKYIDKIFGVMHTAVHYHILCSKLSYCASNQLTVYCSNTNGAAHILCELAVLIKYSENSSKLDELIKRKPISKEGVKEYCQDYAGNIYKYLEDNQENFEAVLNQVCDKISSGYGPMCHYVLKVHYKSIFHNILNFLEGEKPCCIFGLCNATSDNSIMAQADNLYSNFFCDACNVGVTVGQNVLSNSEAAKNKFEHLVKHVTKLLKVPGFVEKAILRAENNIIKSLKKYKNCAVLNVCDSKTIQK